MVDTNDVAIDNAYIPLLIKQTNDVEENLNPTIFDVHDLTVIFCELEHAGDGNALQLNVML